MKSVSSKLGVAQVGCGYWGPNLLRVLSENKDVMKDYDSALRSAGNIVDVESTTVTMDDVLNDDLPESMAS